MTEAEGGLVAIGEEVVKALEDIKRMTEERRHARFSPSFAHIFLNCPGSIPLRETLPTPPPSEASIEGTKAHSLAEIALEDYLQHKLTGSDPNIRAHLLASFPDLEEIAIGYRDAVFNQGLEGSVTGKVYALEDTLTIDEKLDIFGYSDFWAVYRDDRAKKVGLIGDFKSGFYTVPVEKNVQLMMYALGLLTEVRSRGADLDYVRAFIYQPRGDGESYRETKFTIKQLETFKTKLLKVVEDIIVNKKIKYKVGKWCKHCPCKAVCPEWGKSLSNETNLALVTADEITFPVPERIPDEIIKKIVLNASAVEDFVAACKAYARSRCTTGTPIAGLKLVEGSTKRKWDAEKEEVMSKALGKLGVASHTLKVRGITELERELKKKGLDKKILDPYCTRTSPALSLVDDNDPRPAVKAVLDHLNTIEEKENE